MLNSDTSGTPLYKSSRFFLQKKDTFISFFQSAILSAGSPAYHKEVILSSLPFNPSPLLLLCSYSLYTHLIFSFSFLIYYWTDPLVPSLLCAQFSAPPVSKSSVKPQSETRKAGGEVPPNGSSFKRPLPMKSPCKRTELLVSGFHICVPRTKCPYIKCALEVIACYT